MIDILKSLEIAKESASSAGKLLINSKKDLNFEKKSEGKDIKLKAKILFKINLLLFNIK